jgi:hypothetical protein
LTKPQGYEAFTLIIDSSTLIVLHELGASDLLDRLREIGITKVIIPNAAIREFRRAGIIMQHLDPPASLRPRGLAYRHA